MRTAKQAASQGVRTKLVSDVMGKIYIYIYILYIIHILMIH